MSNTTTTILELLIEEHGADKVTASLNKINKSGGRANAVIDKMNKGTANFSKNSTSAFAKQAQGLGGLVHVYATVAANVFAIGAAFQVLSTNRDLQIMKEASDDLSKSTGINFLRAAESIKVATKGMVSFQDATKSANLALAGGLNTQQLKDISEIGTKAAQATGRDAGQSVQRLIQAVVKGEPELADELGIIIRIGKATEDYALAHNKAASELTTFEKQQAVAIQTIERGNKAYKDVEVRVNEFTKLASSLHEVSTEIISLVSTPVISFIKLFGDSTDALSAGIILLAVSIAKKALPTFVDFGKKMTEGVQKAAKASNENIGKIKANLQDLEFGYENVLISNRKLAKGLKTIDPSKLDGRTAAAKALKKGLSGDALVKEFEKTFLDASPKIQAAMSTLLTDLEDTTKKKFGFMGKEFNRAEAQIIGNIGLREIARQNSADLNIMGKATEQFKIRSSNAILGVNKVFQTLNLQIANTKNALLSGFSIGFGTSFGNISKAAANTKKEINALGKSGSTALGTIAAGAVRIGAAMKLTLGPIGLLVTAFLQFQFFKVIFEQLADAFGLLNKDIIEQIDLLDKVGEEITRVQELQKNIENNRKSADQSIEKTIAIFRKEAEVLVTIKDNLSNIRKSATALTKANIFDRLFSSNDQGDVLDKLRKQILILEKSTGKAFKLDNIIIGDTHIPTVTNNIKELENTLNILGPEKFKIFVDVVSANLEWIGNSFEDANNKMAKFGEETVNIFNNLEDITSKFKKTSLVNTTDSRYLAQINSLFKEINGVREAGNITAEKGKDILDVINESLVGVSKETLSILGLQEKYSDKTKAENALIKIQKELNERVTEQVNRKLIATENSIRLANQEKFIAQGSLQAIREKASIEKVILRNKIAALNDELNTQKRSLKSATDKATVQASIQSLENQIALLGDKRVAQIKAQKVELDYIDQEYSSILNNLKQAINFAKHNENVIKDMFTLGEVSREDVSKAISDAQKAYTAEYMTDLEKLTRSYLAALANSPNPLKDKVVITLLDKVNAKILAYETRTNKFKIIQRKEAQELLKLETERLTLSYSILKSNAANSTLYTKQQRAVYALQAISKAQEVSRAKIAELKANEVVDDNTALKIHQEELRIEKEKYDLIKAEVDARLASTPGLQTKGLTAVGDKLSIIAKEFSNSTQTAAGLLVDTIGNTIDSGVNAYVDALRNGENALYAAAQAISNAIQDTLSSFLKTSLKSSIKGFVANLFPQTKGLFDSVAEKTASYTERTAIATEALANGKDSNFISGKYNPSDEVDKIFGKKAEKTTDGFSSFFGKITSNLGGAFKGIFDILKTGAGYLGTGITNLMNSLGSGGGTSIFGSLLSSVVGGIGGSLAGGLASVFGASAGSVVEAAAFNSVSFDAISAEGIKGIFAKGGIMSAKGPIETYSTGGIANKPQLALYGEGRMNEAYVPLPDGKSIPVNMTGGSSAPMNVDITINIDAEGNQDSNVNSGTSGTDGLQKFGELIGSRVRQELIQQKRPGGLLS